MKELKAISAIILAGGYSARMGTNKAELLLQGKSFLARQVEKMRTIGIRDIVISGYETTIQGTRFVPDIYPHRGPLSGIHAGLLAIRESCALVTAVDTPLLPEALLCQLIELHDHGVTLISHGGRMEPLIGVYDKALSRSCEQVLRGNRTSVKTLLRKTGCTVLEYSGDATLLAGCNTPEEYQRLLRTQGQKSAGP